MTCTFGYVVVPAIFRWKIAVADAMIIIHCKMSTTHMTRRKEKKRKTKTKMQGKEKKTKTKMLGKERKTKTKMEG